MRLSSQLAPPPPGPRARPPAEPPRSQLVLLWPLLGLLCCTLGLVPGQAIAEPSVAALSDSERQVFEALPEEKPYNVHIHFLRSNERRHDVFFPALRHLGGGYIGVGADQNYTLAAVAKSEILWLIDIDGDVVQLHKVYGALIPAAATPDELLALFTVGKTTQAKAALAARWPEAEAKALWTIFLRYRGMLAAHLRTERGIRQKGRAVTWLSDPELYRHVRALMQARRVFSRVGDLHGETTLIAIGAAARRTGHLVRTVYLSNVEQWFRYSAQFRRNLSGLPRDDKTVVLRTLARGELPAPDQDRWHFSVQTLDDFLFRMETAQPPARGVLDLMPEMAKARRPGVYGLSWLGTVQALPRPRPEWALLPPLRDDQVAPPRSVELIPWTVLPPLRLGPGLPGTPPPVLTPPAVVPPLVAPAAAPPLVARATVPWESLPPLRSMTPPLRPGLPGPVVPPPPPEVVPPPTVSTNQALPPLQPVTKRLIAWQQLPPLRQVTPIRLAALSWQVLPPLRTSEPEKLPPAVLDPQLLQHPSAPPTPTGRTVPWDSLPALRDAAVPPQRRVPWRRLPPLRSGEVTKAAL